MRGAFENDTFEDHHNIKAIRAYRLAHNKWFRRIELLASILLVLLALVEEPAVYELHLPIEVSSILSACVFVFVLKCVSAHTHASVGLFKHACASCVERSLRVISPR